MGFRGFGSTCPLSVRAAPMAASEEPPTPAARGARRTVVLPGSIAAACTCHKALNKQHILISKEGGLLGGVGGSGGLLTLAWSFPFFDIAKNLLLKTPRIPTIP